MLHAMNIRGEGRYDYSLVAVLHIDLIELTADLSLRGGVSGTLHVRGFAHQKENSLTSVFAEARDVHHLPVDRRNVELEVTRVDHDADGRSYGDRTGIGDRMVDVDEFGFKTAELHRVSRLDRVQLSLLCQLVLVQLVFEDAERQPRSVYRRVYRPQNVRDRSDVILVTVGYQYSADFVRVLLEICYVRNNEVDSEHVVVRKRKSAVYNYDIVLVLENGDVLSYLVETAEHHYLEL